MTSPTSAWPRCGARVSPRPSTDRWPWIWPDAGHDCRAVLPDAHAAVDEAVLEAQRIASQHEPTNDVADKSEKGYTTRRALVVLRRVWAPQARRRTAPALRIRSTRMSRPVTAHATPYQTSSLPDHRRILMSYVSPGLASNSAIS